MRSLRRCRLWGSALPLHAAAAPRAILSCYSDEEISNYIALASPMRQRTGLTLPAKRLWGEIKKIRREGCSWSIPEYVPNDVQHISFPVKDMFERPHGAINISGSSENFSEKIGSLSEPIRKLVAEFNAHSRTLAAIQSTLQ